MEQWSRQVPQNHHYFVWKSSVCSLRWGFSKCEKQPAPLLRTCRDKIFSWWVQCMGLYESSPELPGHSSHGRWLRIPHNNDILFVFFDYFDCTENIVRIWICIVTWKIKPFSICFALVLPAEWLQNHRRSARRNREKIVEFILVTSEEGTLFDIDRRSVVCFVSQWWQREQRSERHSELELLTDLRDIMNHVLVLEMFQRFSNTQTYLNKRKLLACQ